MPIERVVQARCMHHATILKEWTVNQKLNQFIGGKFGSVISKAIQDRVKSGSLKAN